MSSTETAILQNLLMNLAGQQVSDLHLRAGSQPVMRRDGQLEVLTQEQIVTPEFLEAVLGFLLTPQQRANMEQERQVTVGRTFGNRLRLRITAFYQKGLPELAIRFVPANLKGLRELGLPPVFERLVEAERGLVLVAGPFGSGRTTTLMAMLQAVNRSRVRHIATVEEPIEYVLVGEQSIVDQREVGTDVLSWDEAIESLPNEDVDVVAFSRLPTSAVTSAALNLALGGKLVLACLEADSCVKVVEQLIGSFLPDQQMAARAKLADSLLAASVQKLVPRVGGGRVLVTEVLVANPAVKSVIRDGKDYQLQNLLLTSREEGMVAFDHSLAQFVKTGEVRYEEAQGYALDQEVFESLVRR